jgi:hypothetical protein
MDEHATYFSNLIHPTHEFHETRRRPAAGTGFLLVIGEISSAKADERVDWIFE